MSIDTKTNASNIATLGIAEPFILVTSAYHMPRAMLSFAKTEMQALAAPTDYRAKRSTFSWADFLPDASDLEISRIALHEYIGLLYYRLTL